MSSLPTKNYVAGMQATVATLVPKRTRTDTVEIVKC